MRLIGAGREMYTSALFSKSSGPSICTLLPRVPGQQLAASCSQRQSFSQYESHRYATTAFITSTTIAFSDGYSCYHCSSRQ